MKLRKFRLKFRVGGDVDRVEREHTIQSIRDQINMEIASGFLEATPDWLKAWYRYDVRYEPTKTAYPTILVENLEPLCEAARKNSEVFRLVKFMAAKRIEADVVVPPPMSKIVSRFLLGNFEPIGPGSGRRKQWGRDIIIIKAIEELLRGGIATATQRRKLSNNQDYIDKRKEPASELVRIALEKTEIGSMTLKRIQDIWDDKKKRDQCKELFELRVVAEFDDTPEMVRI
jgi:hypothetical protein